MAPPRASAPTGASSVAIMTASGRLAARPRCFGDAPGYSERPRRATRPRHSRSVLPLYRSTPGPESHRNMEIVAIVPARFASTRLPGKPLLSDTGRPLIQHVVEAARTASRLDRVIVATDDPRIADAVTGFGGEVAMTRADHPTGTDRVAEVAARLPKARIIVNLQGDEPEISGAALDLVVSVLEHDTAAAMAT